jgi:mannose-6-phosphate isomerase
VLLETRSVEKPWGRDELPPPFDAAGKRIGEIWFVPPPELARLLAKYIFTSEKLSVQVHPSDADAPGQGKDECWLVIDADAGARLGIGLVREMSAEELRAAALDGSIESLLGWRPVAAGDFFSIPAGTVHAIGGGVSLVEIQQNSDTTYRLYDYGRPRELHLEQALAVARRGPYDERLHRRLAPGESATLVSGPHFRVDLIAGSGTGEALGGPLLAIPLAGEVTVGGEPVAAGQCGLARASGEVEVRAGARCLLAGLLA